MSRLTLMASQPTCGNSGWPMDKNRIARPTRPGELAQHSEAGRSMRGGKCGGRAGEPLDKLGALCLSKGNAFLPGEALAGQPGRESAEAIVPSSEPGVGNSPFKRRGRKTRYREPSEARRAEHREAVTEGNGNGRTEQERFDRAADAAADHA